MSGHSKWASIKHKKGAADAKRGKLFSRLIRVITVAAREGGGDPKNNAALAQAIDKAKENNMPADNIDRAIKRGTGEIKGAEYEQITYEAYAPNGVAVMIEVMTDNRNRAASDVRSILTKHGGNMGAQGSVNWMFSRKGVILVGKSAGLSEDEMIDLAIEGGADDVNVGDDHFEIVVDPAALDNVKKYLTDKGVAIESSEITMFPQTTVKLDKDAAKKILRLMDALQDAEDVQEVFANFDIPDQILEEIAKTI
jgi:YebC/PmpR family DNA-binding regulatory protein